MHASSIKEYFSSRSRNSWQELENKLINVKRYIIRWHKSIIGALVSQTGQQEQILLTIYKYSIKENFHSRSRNGWPELKNKLIEVKRYITKYHKVSVWATVSQTVQQVQIVSNMHDYSIKGHLSSRSRNGWQELASKLIKVMRYIIRWHKSSIGVIVFETGQQEQILSIMYENCI